MSTSGVRHKAIRFWFAWALLFMPVAQTAYSMTPGYAKEDSRTFPATGKTVRGTFLDYWDTHGGLPQQGDPISDELQERNDTDGKMYTVQYFERAVFELHPENQPPYDVLLSLLGVFRYKQKYPHGAPQQAVNTDSSAVLFPETGK